MERVLFVVSCIITAVLALLFSPLFVIPAIAIIPVALGYLIKERLATALLKSAIILLVLDVWATCCLLLTPFLFLLSLPVMVVVALMAIATVARATYYTVINSIILMIIESLITAMAFACIMAYLGEDPFLVFAVTFFYFWLVALLTAVVLLPFVKYRSEVFV